MALIVVLPLAFTAIPPPMYTVPAVSLGVLPSMVKPIVACNIVEAPRKHDAGVGVSDHTEFEGRVVRRVIKRNRVQDRQYI